MIFVTKSQQNRIALVVRPVHQLHNDQLEDVAEGVDLVNAAGQVLQCLVLIRMDEHHEGVPLAAGVLLSLKESQHDFRSVRDEEIEVLVDGENCQNGVTPDVRVAVF